VCALYVATAILANLILWAVVFPREGMSFLAGDWTNPSRALPFIAAHTGEWRLSPTFYIVADFVVLVEIFAVIGRLRARSSPGARIAVGLAIASSMLFLVADGVNLKTIPWIAEHAGQDPAVHGAGYLAAWFLRVMLDHVAVLIGAVWIAIVAVIALIDRDLPAGWCGLALLYCFLCLTFFLQLTPIWYLTDPVGILVHLWLGIILLREKPGSPLPTTSPAS
jgi:hypothetical protein